MSQLRSKEKNKQTCDSLEKMKLCRNDHYSRFIACGLLRTGKDLGGLETCSENPSFSVRRGGHSEEVMCPGRTDRQSQGQDACPDSSPSSPTAPHKSNSQDKGFRSCIGPGCSSCSLPPSTELCTLKVFWKNLLNEC